VLRYVGRISPSDTVWNILANVHWIIIEIGNKLLKRRYDDYNFTIFYVYSFQFVLLFAFELLFC
jgi:hypothetical protein